MKSIPYAFYVSDIQLEPRIFDCRVDRAVPLGKILETTAGQPADASLAAMNVAIDVAGREPDASEPKLPGNFYLSQFRDQNGRDADAR